MEAERWGKGSLYHLEGTCQNNEMRLKENKHVCAAVKGSKQGSAKLGNTFPDDTELWSQEDTVNMTELQVHIALFQCSPLSVQ